MITTTTATTGIPRKIQKLVLVPQGFLGRYKINSS